MLKKMVLLAVVGFVGVTVLAGTKIGSYIRSEFNAARDRVEDGIPPEKEIARLRSEVKLLDKDIMTVVNQLAKERVDVNDLKEKVDTLAVKQQKDKVWLTDRANAIKNAEGHVTFGNRKLSVDEAKEELAQDVKRFATNQSTLESMERTLSHRIKVRDTLEKQLETMKNQKSQLASEIDGMESQLTELKLQQMESKYQTDDTRLAKIKEDLKKLKTKMDVEREKLKLMPTVNESSPAAASGSKSVDEIMAPLNGSKADAKPEAPKTGNLPKAE